MSAQPSPGLGAFFLFSAQRQLALDRHEIARTCSANHPGSAKKAKAAALTSIAAALGKFMAAALKLPVIVYRYTLKPFVGHNCRHLPSCSEYALEAIDKNGPWRGFWLTLSRLLRCHPWGTSGFDPVPDTRAERHPFWAPWRHGRWRSSHLHQGGAGR